MKKLILLLAVGLAAHVAHAQVYGKTSSINPADYDLPREAPGSPFRMDETLEPDGATINFVLLPGSGERLDLDGDFAEWEEPLAARPDSCAVESGAGAVAQADGAELMTEENFIEPNPERLALLLESPALDELVGTRPLPAEGHTEPEYLIGPDQPVSPRLADALDAEDQAPVGETPELSEEKTDRPAELVWQEYWEQWVLHVRATTPPTMPVEVGTNTAAVTQEGTTHQSALGSLELPGTGIEQLGDDQVALIVQEENTSQAHLVQIGTENLAFAAQEASDNSVQMQQIGERNNVALDQLSGGNTVMLRQMGNGNAVRIEQDTPPGGEAGGNAVALVQVGMGNAFSGQQEGADNLATGPDGLPAEQRGHLNLILLDQQGESNAFLTKQEGDGHLILVFQNGQKNLSRVIQKTVP